ncbi:MAG: substrate-binding domain-containing protein [Gemmatimonadaceae bacterium]|nr:substrate-binding domain-containing protein [Gemmatimonadaceae bacterium]
MTRSRTTAPKHHEVFTTLLKEIQDGQWQEGQRLPSEAQLTERFGLSRITVGRALRDLQAAGVITRRAGAGSFVSRHSEPTGARSFGVLIADIAETEIYEAICRGMMASPLAQEHALLFGSSSRDLPSGDAARRDERAWHLCQQYIEREVDGVFFAPVSTLVEPDDVNHRIVRALDAAGIPVVLLDRPVTNYPDPGWHDLVGIDNRRAGYMMTMHLLDRGAKRTIFFRRPNSAPTVDARESGYRQALNTRGILPQAFAARLDPDDGGAVRAMLDAERPDAIVCSSDRTAARLMHTLLRLGVRIPQDVRMVGIDDVEYASLLPVPLTTLRQPTLELGVVALSMMLTRVAHRDLPARDTRLRCEMVVRESCGPAPDPV